MLSNKNYLFQFQIIKLSLLKNVFNQLLKKLKNKLLTKDRTLYTVQIDIQIDEERSPQTEQNITVIQRYMIYRQAVVLGSLQNLHTIIVAYWRSDKQHTVQYIQYIMYTILCFQMSMWLDESVEGDLIRYGKKDIFACRLRGGRGFKIKADATVCLYTNSQMSQVLSEFCLDGLNFLLVILSPFSSFFLSLPPNPFSRLSCSGFSLPVFILHFF